MIDWRERLREVDRRVDDRVGTHIFDICFVFFLFLLPFIFLGGDKDVQK
jgi:hypothetical protein